VRIVHDILPYLLPLLYYLAALVQAVVLPATQSRPARAMSKTLEDGRDAAERQCTKLACAFEHCFQQHKYKMAPPCEAKWKEYETCVADTRRRLAEASQSAAAGKGKGTGARG
jgi:hypothetical protein